MSILKTMTRELASQRTISLFKDQEDKVAELGDNGVKLQFSDVVRMGVDLVLSQIEEELNNK